MPAWMVPLAIEGGKTLASYGAGLLGQNSRKRSQRKYLKYLGDMAKNGAYSPEMQRGAIAPMARETANVAQQSTADTRGRLAQQGMGNSIAGTRLLADPSLRRMGALGDASNRMGMANAASKVEATRSLADARMGFDQENADASMQNNMNLAGGLANAGMNAYSQDQYDQMHGEIMPQVQAAMAKGDKNMALMLLMQLMSSRG